VTSSSRHLSRMQTVDKSKQDIACHPLSVPLHLQTPRHSTNAIIIIIIIIIAVVVFVVDKIIIIIGITN